MKPSETDPPQTPAPVLTLRYVTTLLVIAGLVVAAYFALVQATTQAHRTASAIETAWSMRALTQRVGVLAVELAHATESDDRAGLREEFDLTITRLEASWEDLRQVSWVSEEAGQLLGDPLPALLETLVQQAQELSSHSNSDLTPETPAVLALRRTVSQSATVEAFDRLVDQLQEERRDREDRLLGLERLLAVVVLGVLLLSGLAVFRPMSRRIDQETSRLANLRGHLDQLVEQRTAAAVERASGLVDSREALRRQTEVLQSVLDHMEDGVVVVDQEGEVVLHNPSAMRFGGTNIQGSARDLWTGGLGLYRSDGVSPARWEELPLNRVIYGEDHSEGEFLLKDDGGAGTWIHAIARPLTSDTGAVRGAVMVFRDMTSRHRAEQDLRDLAGELGRSNRDLEQFAYIASHDLQEPLRVVRSYVQLLDRRYADQLDVDAKEFIGFIVDGTSRMSALIRDLLAYSRAGPRRREAQSMHLSDAVEAALANLRAAIRESGAEVSWEELPEVKADQAQVTQLLQNLIGNAIKFRGEDSCRVVVAAERSGEDWRITVADDGIGIDPAYQERIFSIFQRLHTREAYSGTGIGLSICKRIVESHGGQIGVESAEGAGATFWFTLPGVETALG